MAEALQAQLDEVTKERDAEREKCKKLMEKVKKLNDELFEIQKTQLTYKKKASAAEAEAKGAKKTAEVEVSAATAAATEAAEKLEQQKSIARSAAARISELEQEVKTLGGSPSKAAAPTSPGDDGATLPPGAPGAEEIAALRAVLQEREQQIQMALSIVGSALGNPIPSPTNIQ